MVLRRAALCRPLDEGREPLGVCVFSTGSRPGKLTAEQQGAPSRNAEWAGRNSHRGRTQTSSIRHSNRQLPELQHCQKHPARIGIDAAT